MTGFFKIISENNYEFLEVNDRLPIVVVDAIGRWGYVINDKVLFPVQYERSVEILTQWGTAISYDQFFRDNNDNLYPLLTSSIDFSILKAERIQNGWIFKTLMGQEISHFHDVQGYFHEGRVFIDNPKNFVCLDLNGKPLFHWIMENLSKSKKMGVYELSWRH